MAEKRADEPFQIAMYVDEHGEMPVVAFFDVCPDPIEERVTAVVIAVAEAPPHRFAGGGMWEAMHGDMRGWYEVRVDHRRRHYRVFCLLDATPVGRPSLLVLVDGLQKPRGSLLTPREYARIRRQGERYFSTLPRPIA